MSNQVRFGDHTEFHFQVLRLTVAGAALGLLGHLLGMATDLSGQAAQVISMAVAATVLGLAALPPSRKTALTVVLLGLGLGLLGALSFHALSQSTPRYPWFGVGVYGLVVGLLAGRDLKDFRRYLLPLATGLSTALALYVMEVFRARIDFANYVPSFLAEPAYGALFGFLLSIGLLLRQVRLERDPVAKAFQEIRPSLSGEMLELCQRAVTLYARVQQVLHDRQEQGNSTEPNLLQATESLVLRIFGLARKWQEVEQEAGRTSADELAERIANLTRKIEQSSDAVARRQYTLAREALNTQLGYLKDISRSGERVTAQVHNYLAVLERLHLAVINHRGADAAKLSDEIHPILDELENIGCEMEFATEGISEAESATAEGPVASADRPALPAPDSPAASTEAQAPAGPASQPEEPAADGESSETQVASSDEEKEEGKGDSDDPESRLQARIYE